MPSRGFQPEAIQVWGCGSYKGSVFLNTFVRLRKSDDHGPANAAFVHQIDLLGQAAAAAEERLALMERVRALEKQATATRSSIDHVRDEILEESSSLREQLNVLREAVGSPRTPFERVYRRLSGVWRGRARQGK
jgi:hypothetical protein